MINRVKIKLNNPLQHTYYVKQLNSIIPLVRDIHNQNKKKTIVII